MTSADFFAQPVSEQVFFSSEINKNTGNRRNNLSNQTIEIGVCRSFNVQVSPANVIQSLIVNHEGNVGMLQSVVGFEDGIVGLDDGGGDLWRGINGKFQLGLFAKICGKALHE